MAAGNCPMFGSKLIGSFETVRETLTGNSVVETPVLCEESLDPSCANKSHAERHEMRTVKIMHRRIEITPCSGIAPAMPKRKAGKRDTLIRNNHKTRLKEPH